MGRTYNLGGAEMIGENTQHKTDRENKLQCTIRSHRSEPQAQARGLSTGRLCSRLGKMVRSRARSLSRHVTALTASLCLVAASLVWGQGPAVAGADPAAGSAASADRSQPDDRAAVVEPLVALVIEVSGTVDWARPGASPATSKGWTPVKWKDRLEPGTQIRTGLRSFVHLQFGKTTVVAVRSATHASIDQLFRSATTEHVRLGLGYGTVRGGSVEGKIRSDVVIDSTVATLAKRGTEGWEMQVEPMTGRFKISLAEYGLVEAMQKLRSARRTSRQVRPGEYVTDANIANMWIKQDIFDRNVQFYQADAVTVADADFTSENTRGYSVLAPGGGSTLVDASERVSSDFVLGQIAQNFPDGTLPPTTLIVPTQPVARPEGNFGTGQTFRVLLPDGARRRAVQDASAGRRLKPGR